MMTKKEMIKEVINEYLYQYDKETGIYNGLSKYGIYINIETELKDAYLEKILNSIHPAFLEMLLELHDNENTWVDDVDGKGMIFFHSVDELLNYFVKEEE